MLGFRDVGDDGVGWGGVRKFGSRSSSRRGARVARKSSAMDSPFRRSSRKNSWDSVIMPMVRATAALWGVVEGEGGEMELRYDAVVGIHGE